MKAKVTALSLVVFLGAGMLMAQESSPEQQLLQLERDWCAAELKKDADLLGRILADDFTGVTSRGIKLNKTELLKSLMDPDSATNTCSDADVKVRVYGDTAVVTGRGSRSGTYKGKSFKDRQILYTDTFVRKGGRWQVVASHATEVAK